jgi:hypothetical protein
MTIRSTRDILIGGLRSCGPLYRFLRRVWRMAKGTSFAMLRALSPRRSFLGLPKGTFSLAEVVRRGAVPGEILFDRQEIPSFSPDSLVRRAGLRQDNFQPWPVFWARMDGARLVGPNWLPLDVKKRACEEAMFGREFARFDASYNRFNLARPTRLTGNWTSLPGRLDEGYWHFLMDSIPRLHALARFPADTKILIRPRPEPWMMEIYEMLGVRDRLVEAHFSCAEVERYYFSSFTSMTGACNPFAVRFLREHLLQHDSPANFALPALPADSAPESPLCLFLKRGDAWTRGIQNRDEVWATAALKGWTLLEPERFSVREQIALFSRADAVCAMHGSALTNILWMRPGTAMIELTADNFILGGFEWLSRCLDIQHHALICPGDSRFRIRVDLDSFGKLLDRVKS